MKIFTAEHYLKHPWRDVTRASWLKYPNEYSPQVQHVDVLDRYVDSDGVLHTQRLIACQQPIPGFIKQLFGTDAIFFFLERSTVDVQGMVHKSHTQNITYQDMIKLDERLVYTDGQTDGGLTDKSKSNKQGGNSNGRETQLVQEASVESFVGGFPKIKSLIEEFCIDSCRDNAQNGRLALEQAIGKHD